MTVESFIEGQNYQCLFFTVCKYLLCIFERPWKVRRLIILNASLVSRDNLCVFLEKEFMFTWS